MIVELSGQAGVGKFTIGRILAQRIGARLLDNHTIYNPAFAITEFRSPEFYETVRSVREIAFERAAELPASVPIIVTMAPGTDRAWGEEWQAAFRSLADARNSRLLAVHLTCPEEEHHKRLVTPERALMRKLTDVAALGPLADRPALLDHADAVLELDVGHLTADAAAQAIAAWLDESAP